MSIHDEKSAFFDVAIIGGGPAGMMAAWSAARRGRKTILLERNKKLGKKLFLTGKGRCNITNASDMRVCAELFPRNHKFLHSALNAFSNRDLMEFFEQRGLSLDVERGGRVFPASGKSSDVIRTLERTLRDHTVRINLSCGVRALKMNQNRLSGVLLENGDVIRARNVIVATGGRSYPQTGSTGDGYNLGAQAGHTITPLSPALAPVETERSVFNEADGLLLKNVEATLESDTKTVFKDLGEIQIASFGLSGALILRMSSLMQPYLAQSVPLTVKIDLKPGLSEEQLDRRLQRDFQTFAKREFRNALGKLLPRQLIAPVVALAHIPGEKSVAHILKEERLSLCRLLKNIEFPITGLRPLEEALVTRGGICVKEVNPSTMESKMLEGLSFAGEILDIDGITGGYNLQIAFSTGFLAGLHA